MRFPNKWKFGFFLFFLTILIFFPTLRNGFTNWDDPLYVLENELLMSFSPENIGKIFSTFLANHYHPLTVITYLFEYTLAGPNPFIFHFTSLLLHAFNAMLLFLMFHRLGKTVILAFFTALLFAVHPIHVESVSWVSGRKDLLYASFYLLGLITYLRYLDYGFSRREYLLSLGLFLCSCLSKVMAISFPVMILLFDFQRKRKLSFQLVIEKVPFFCFSILFVVIGLTGQKNLVVPIEKIDPLNIFLYVCFELRFYLEKLFFPLNLSAVYPWPEPEGNFLLPEYYLNPVLLILAGTGCTIIKAFRGKAFFGILFGLICIFPTLQINSKGYSFASDRYLYLASAGFFYTLAEAVFFFYRKFLPVPKKKKVLFAIFLIPLFFFSVISWERCKVWKNTSTLFNNVLEQFPRELFSRHNLVYFYMDSGNFQEARRHAEIGLGIKPSSTSLRNALARSFLLENRPDQAIESLKASLSLNPDNDVTHSMLGHAFFLSGNTDRAIEELEAARKLNPLNFLALLNLGIAYEKKGNIVQAEKSYLESISANPVNFKGYSNLAVLYWKNKDFEKAEKSFRKAGEIDPENPWLKETFANFLRETGKSLR